MHSYAADDGMPLHLNGVSPGDYELPKLTGLYKAIPSQKRNTPAYSFGKQAKTTRKMPFINASMIEGVIDREPKHEEVPYYNVDKTPVLQSSEKFSIPKKDRFDTMPSYKRYQLTV